MPKGKKPPNQGAINPFVDRVGNAMVLTCNNMIWAGANIHKELARAASLQTACRTTCGDVALPNTLLIKPLYTQALMCV